MSEKKSKNIVIIALCITLIFIGVGFAALSETLTINGTATVTVQGLDYTTSNDPELSIYLNWVQQGEDKTMEVRPYAEVSVSPAGWWTFTLSKPLYVPYGGSIGFNNTDTTTDNPATADIYGDNTIVDTLTITATPDDWYTFSNFQSIIGSDWYEPVGGRNGIDCMFTPLS